MTSQQCLDLATEIVKEQSDWFKDGADTKLNPEKLAVEVADTYYALALPVSADSVEPEGSRFIEGLAGGCKFGNCSFAPFYLICRLISNT